MKKSFLLLLLLNSLLVGGCSTIATDEGELTGQSLLHERRTRDAILMDKRIETEAYDELNSDDDIVNQCHFTVTAYNGTVLVTGETPNEEFRKKIISTARVIPGVKLIHNELVIAEPIDAASRANDALITDTIRIALNQIHTLPDFDPSMVKVITENGTVYLMGLVRRDEGAVVINLTRVQPGVKQIITVFEYVD
ncbi:MAG: BON domain-containing protein [Gammaproteobacteria bacterium]